MAKPLPLDELLAGSTIQQLNSSAKRLREGSIAEVFQQDDMQWRQLKFALSGLLAAGGAIAIARGEPVPPEGV